MNVAVDNPPSDLVLGEVRRVRDTLSNDKVCELSPLLTSKGAGWEAVNDLKDSFPDQGLVFWWHPPAEIQENQLCVVRIAEHPGYDEIKNRDFYGVSRGEYFSPIEGVELQGIEDFNSLRHRLSGGKINLPKKISDRILVKLPFQPNGWAGPFKAHLEAEDNGYVYSLSCTNDLVQTYEFSNDAFVNVQATVGNSLILHPGVNIDDGTGYLLVQSDSVLLQSLYKKIRKFDRNLSDSLKITKRIFSGYVEAIQVSNLPNDDNQKENARIEALSHLLGTIDDNHGSFQELVDAVLANEMVNDRIQEVIDARAEAAKVEVQEKILEAENEYKLRRSKLVELQDSATATLEKFKKDSLGIFLKNEAINLVVSGRKNLPATENKRSDATANLAADIATIESLSDLKVALAQAAMSTGVDPRLTLVIAGLIQPTGMALISGPQAELYASSIGIALCKGTNARAQISTTTFGINDLLRSTCIVGEKETAKSMLVGEFLSSRSNDEFLSLLTLEGLNRAPPEGFFTELSNAKNAPHTLGMIPWEHPTLGAQACRISPNVLLIGTVSSGSSTFPFPSFMREIPVVSTSRKRTTLSDPSLLDTMKGCRLKTEAWNKLFDAKRELPQAFDALEGNDSLEISALNRIKKYFQSLSYLFELEEDAFSEALVGEFLGRQEAIASLGKMQGLRDQSEDKIKSICTDVMQDTYLDAFSK
jgi:hypothetical protein